MADDAHPTMQSQFTGGLDLCGALAALNIEFLDVSSERAIAIDGRSILNLEVVDGHLTDTWTVEIGLLDQPPTASAAPHACLEAFAHRLETAAATEQRGIDGSGASPS
ncbi:hypothetical protein [Haloterrigena salinisoli]|uniref:hypothetical protein n=1 Tax=Haloterrigena salinisoli TaxID=3132747 RepID=UPI0030CC0DE5